MKLLSSLMINLVLFLAVSCGGGGGGGSSSGGGDNIPPVNHNVELSFFLDENSTISINNSAYGNLELIAITENPLNGVASLVSGVIHYEPNEDYFGIDRIVLSMMKNGNNALLTINLTVNKLNTPPITNDMNLFVVKGNGLFFNLDAFDEDGDNLTYELVESPAFGNLVLKPANSSSWGYDSLNEEYQTYFTYRVHDGKSYSNLGTVTINVTRPNQAPTFPIAFPSNASLDEDTIYNYNFSVQDIDGDIVSGVIISSPTNGNAVLNNPSNNYFELTYTPDQDYFGNDFITIEISDGLGGVSERTISLTILSVNDAPEVSLTNVSIILDKNEIIGELIDFGLEDIDTPNESLFIIYDTPSTLVDLYYISSTKEVLFTPKFNVEGEGSFVFRFSDGILTTEPITVNFKVNGDPLPALVPTNKSTTVLQNASVAFTLEGNTEGRNVIFEIIEYPDGGEDTITGTLPNLTYTPNSTFYGSTNLQFKIRDVDTNELSPLGFIDITVQRTDFSNVWSVDLLGNIKEGVNLKQDASFVLGDFFLSEVNNSAEFSISTNHMNCGRFDTEFIWMGMNTNNLLTPFSRSENWFCRDSFFIVQDKDILVSSEELVKSIYKEKGFSNLFNPNEVNKFQAVKNEVNSCQSFNDINELIFELGEENSLQEDCYLEIANLLKNNLSDYLDSFYLINDYQNLKEGSYSLVKDFLNFVKQEDIYYSHLDKENFIFEVVDRLNYPNYTIFSTLNNFNSCKEYFSDMINDEEEEIYYDPIDFLYSFLDSPVTDSQEACYIDLFNFISTNYSEFYTKTGYMEPSNFTEVEFIIRDMFNLFLDQDNQDKITVNYETCTPEAKFLKEYYFNTRIQSGQSYYDYLKTIGGGVCSDAVLESEYIYSNNIGSLFHIDNNFEEDMYSPALVNCHLAILQDMESGVMYNTFRTKKGQTGSYDLLNKINIGIILEAVLQNEYGLCEDEEPLIVNLNESIFESNEFSLYVKETPIKKEVYFGYSKYNLNEDENTEYSLNYSSFNGQSIIKTSLISAESKNLNSQVLFKEQMDENSNLGDYILLPERELFSQQIYTRISDEVPSFGNSELILRDLYILNSGIMEKVKDSFVGKMFMMNSKMIINTVDTDSGYYLIEVSN